nr:immunoglobulin heavy chain junction region [Mus musculus]
CARRESNYYGSSWTGYW